MGALNELLNQSVCIEAFQLKKPVVEKNIVGAYPTELLGLYQ